MSLSDLLLFKNTVIFHFLNVVCEKFGVVVVGGRMFNVFHICCLIVRYGEVGFIALSVKQVTVFFVGNWMLRKIIEVSSWMNSFCVSRCVDVVISY